MNHQFSHLFIGQHSFIYPENVVECQTCHKKTNIQKFNDGIFMGTKNEDGNEFVYFQLDRSQKCSSCQRPFIEYREIAEYS